MYCSLTPQTGDFPAVIVAPHLLRPVLTGHIRALTDAVDAVSVVEQHLIGGVKVFDPVQMPGQIMVVVSD